MLKLHFLRSLAAITLASTCSVYAQSPAPAPAAGEEAKPVTGKVKVTMETTKGKIELELDADKAPITVNNFVNYARKGFYEGTIFHRVIPGFMIQGGGFTEDGTQKTADKSIINEGKNGLTNKRGTIAMARTSDPNSATAQFFINVKDNEGLDYPSPDGYGYAVFGKVTDGMKVVDAIVNAPTTTHGMLQNFPKDTIKITKVTVK
jgi:cyclophilin family peptidyl-prolyl cis-trans isomerase